METAKKILRKFVEFFIFLGLPLMIILTLGTEILNRLNKTSIFSKAVTITVIYLIYLGILILTYYIFITLTADKKRDKIHEKLYLYEDGEYGQFLEEMKDLYYKFPNAHLKEETMTYMAKAYIKMGENKKAFDTLDQISKEDMDINIRGICIATYLQSMLNMGRVKEVNKIYDENKELLNDELNTLKLNKKDDKNNPVYKINIKELEDIIEEIEKRQGNIK